MMMDFPIRDVPDLSPPVVLMDPQAAAVLVVAINGTGIGSIALMGTAKSL
jgi:hypothetical protein